MGTSLEYPTPNRSILSNKDRIVKHATADRTHSGATKRCTERTKAADFRNDGAPSRGQVGSNRAKSLILGRSISWGIGPLC